MGLLSQAGYRDKLVYIFWIFTSMFLSLGAVEIEGHKDNGLFHPDSGRGRIHTVGLGCPEYLQW